MLGRFIGILICKVRVTSSVVRRVGVLARTFLELVVSFVIPPIFFFLVSLVFY